MESTSAVVDGEGHGRLKYTFGGSTGGGDNDDIDSSGGVSVQCNAEGCTIDFDNDLDDAVAADSAGVISDGGDMMNASILECTLTGEDGGFECTAITDTADLFIDNQDPPPDPHPDQDPNLVVTSSSFDAGTVTNIDSRIRVTTPQRLVAE